MDTDIPQPPAEDPPAETAPRDEPPKRDDRRPRHHQLELLIAVALGLAAIAGAFAAYKNEERNHAATVHFNEGITGFNDAGQLLAGANTILSRDQSLFLAYVTAQHDGKNELASFIRQHLMDRRLQEAVAWWQSPANTGQPVPAQSPFVSGDPKYVIPQRSEAAQTTRQSERRFEQAKLEQENAAHFQLIEIILATSLFLYGIAAVTPSMTVKLSTLGTGIAIFLFAVVLEITP